MKKIELIGIGFLCIFFINGYAQNQNGTSPNIQSSNIAKADSNAALEAKKGCNCKVDSLTIDSVMGLGSLYNNGNAFSIDDFLVVRIKESIDSLVSSHKKDPLMLWFNGIPFPNLALWKANTCKHELIFSLKYDSGSHSSWNTLNGYAYRDWFKPGKKVIVQVGTIDKCLSIEYKNSVTINIREGWMMFWGYFFIFCLLCLFIWLIFYKRVLQDGVPFDSSVKLVNKFSQGNHDNEVQRKDIPYSLSRAQLCFWIFIVASSIIFIWLNLDDLAIVTTSTAYLIGISGGTSVVTKIIETTTNNRASTIKLTAQEFYSKNKTEGFFKDILSDASGISISRVQMVIFTIIIGFDFCWHVIYYLQMPSLSDGILILMGISSSTYAGVKYNENPVSTDKPKTE